MARIMVVDDEQMVLDAIRREIKSPGREILLYEKSMEAAQALEHEDFDLIITDYRMPEMDGVQLLERAKRLKPRTLRVVISGESDWQFLKDAINYAEIYRFISKPWNEFDLKSTVEQALAYADLQKRNAELLAEVHSQQSKIEQQRREIARLEKSSPGITHIDRDEDGAIVISK